MIVTAKSGRYSQLNRGVGCPTDLEQFVTWRYDVMFFYRRLLVACWTSIWSLHFDLLFTYICCHTGNKFCFNVLISISLCNKATSPVKTYTSVSKTWSIGHSFHTLNKFLSDSLNSPVKCRNNFLTYRYQKTSPEALGPRLGDKPSQYTVINVKRVQLCKPTVSRAV